jgi:hypothetical protein
LLVTLGGYLQLQEIRRHGDTGRLEPLINLQDKPEPVMEAAPERIVEDHRGLDTGEQANSPAEEREPAMAAKTGYVRAEPSRAGAEPSRAGAEPSHAGAEPSHAGAAGRQPEQPAAREAQTAHQQSSGEAKGSYTIRMDL